ncbi:ATP-binding protein [Minwuia sp.]|uniref:ATP-binding protein n=1 Tax=Minwuia sp. TaxID=2493630 RepID=UPI003A8F266E
MTQSHSASFQCLPDQVTPAAHWVEVKSASVGLSRNDPLRLALIAEELFANTLHHANVTSRSAVSFSVSRDGDEVRLDYREPGAFFNPLEADVPDTPDLNRWPIGGLGLRLIHNIPNRADYRRDGEVNHLSIWMAAG